MRTLVLLIADDVDAALEECAVLDGNSRRHQVADHAARLADLDPLPSGNVSGD